MNILDKTKKRLEEYPQLSSEVLEAEHYECITIKPKSNGGFTVSLYLYKDGEFQVGGDGWRYEMEDLKDDEDAIKKFILCLSNKSRLKVLSRGDKEYRWDIEVENNGKWRQDTVVIDMPAFLSCFWKKRVERIFQNNYIRK